MTREEFITELEEIFQVEEGELETDTRLKDMEEWDSMAALALADLFHSRLSKSVTTDEIANLETIGDIIKLSGL